MIKLFSKKCMNDEYPRLNEYYWNKFFKDGQLTPPKSYKRMDTSTPS